MIRPIAAMPAPVLPRSSGSAAARRKRRGAKPAEFQPGRKAWRGIALTITFTADWLSVADHLEIMSDGRVPLPVCETGCRSIFLHRVPYPEWRPRRLCDRAP